jgi:ribosome-associated protein
MATERRPRARAASARPRKTSLTARRSSRTKSTVRKSTGAIRSAKTSPATKGPKRGKAAKVSQVPADVALAVSAALDKKAEQVHVLDLRNGSAFTDFFVIATGNNIRQVQAIADGIEETLKKTGIRPALVEGYSRAEWILLDYFDFIVHVFTPATRDFYALERLWGDAERIDVSA